MLRGELSQVAVSERTGIAQNRLSRYENDKQIPDLPTLDRLLSFYGVDVERLGRALKEVRGEKPVRKRSGNDPEFTAKVQDALIQLGYPKPDPNNTAPADWALASRFWRERLLNRSRAGPGSKPIQVLLW